VINMKGILGVLRRRKSAAEELQGGEGDPVRINYSSVDALRKGFRDFHDKTETRSNSKAMPQEHRKPAGGESHMSEAGEPASTGDEPPAIGDESVWDIFESETAEDPVFQMLLRDLTDINAFELFEECKQVAHRLRRRRFVGYGSH